MDLFLQLPGAIGLFCLQEDLSLVVDLPLHLNNLKEGGEWGALLHQHLSTPTQKGLKQKGD